MPEANGGGKSLVVATPSHLQEAVYSYKTATGLLFSNSLVWLLAEAGLELDENYHDYEADLCSVIFGEDKMRRQLPLKGCKTVTMHRNCNVAVGTDLSLSETGKSRHPAFADYQAYTGYVRSILKAIRQNATDPARRHPYGMISTISQGYDATATSALAYEIGCREVLTMRLPADDNGTDIAQRMGYDTIHQIERDAYKGNESLLEAEAAATGSTAGIYEPYEALCRGKLIFLGDRGDSVWERLHDNVNDRLDFHAGNGYSQASLYPMEHLLRINSIIVSIPLIGADSWSWLARISQSDEMAAWSVGDRYDRPIPRRIVESIGIDRESFGRRKAGAGISYHFNTFGSLRHKMAAASFASLAAYRRQLHRKRLPLLKALWTFYRAEAPVFANYLFRKLHLPSRVHGKSAGCTSSPLTSLLFLWGVHEMTKRYQQ